MQKHRNLNASWTDAEDAIIRVMAAEKKSAAAIAARLKRSVAATRSRARKIGTPLETVIDMRKRLWVDLESSL